MINEFDDFPALQQGLGLEVMYYRQENYMLELKGANKLFDFPVDINSKESQALTRQYFDFFEEELFELLGCYKLGLSKFENTSNISKEELYAWQREMHSELADVYHFALELNIILSIEPADISVTLKELAETENWGLSVDAANVLSSIFNLSRLFNAKNLLTPMRNTYFKVELSDYFFPLEGEPYYKFGLMLGPEIYNQITNCLFEVISEYREAIQMLKNKPWRDNPKELNTAKFKKQFIFGFLALNAFLVNFGCDEDCLFNSYVEKNKIILERIKNQY